MSATSPDPGSLFNAIGSVVIADFDRTGRLIGGNAGLRRLIGRRTPTLWQLVVQPAVDGLMNSPPAADGSVYAGYFTVRRGDRPEVTLEGTFYLVEGRFRLIAGYDMDQYESMSTSLLALNDEVTTAYRELAKSRRELSRKNEQVEKMSLTDALTGVGNRRHLDDALRSEVLRASRYHQPLSLLILDVDHFKRVNDGFGHEAGDRVLRSIGALLLASLRETDIATRMGGEEFVVLLVATGLDDAVMVAERLRLALSAHDVGLPSPVTASFGVALLQGGEDGPALLARADQALYSAKQQGRNRVVTA